ncbi:MAG: SEL1-like repeat protein [Alphaproteobacteria bacterium]|nr:SEL1-like repeat protein [Alphaproteobacteria bacterium]
MRTRTFALMLSTLALAGPAAGADYGAGLRCYEYNDFGCAMGQWMPLAMGGMTRAQYRIGSFYAEGTGVPVDMAEAYKWFSLAAAKGDRTAAEALASITPTMTRDQVEEGLRRAREFGMRRR